MTEPLKLLPQEILFRSSAGLNNFFTFLLSQTDLSHYRFKDKTHLFLLRSWIRLYVFRCPDSWERPRGLCGMHRSLDYILKSWCVQFYYRLDATIQSTSVRNLTQVFCLAGHSAFPACCTTPWMVQKAQENNLFYLTYVTHTHTQNIDLVHEMSELTWNK